jgi:hypothetical protein
VNLLSYVGFLAYDVGHHIPSAIQYKCCCLTRFRRYRLRAPIFIPLLNVAPH